MIKIFIAIMLFSVSRQFKYRAILKKCSNENDDNGILNSTNIDRDGFSLVKNNNYYMRIMNCSRKLSLNIELNNNGKVFFNCYFIFY